MKLKYNSTSFDVLPLVIYKEGTEGETDDLFYYQGEAYYLSKFTSVIKGSIMGREGWELFYLIDLYRSVVIRKYLGTATMHVAIIEVEREDLESLILQILFGGKHD